MKAASSFSRVCTTSGFAIMLLLVVQSTNQSAYAQARSNASTVARAKNGLPPCTMDSFVHDAGGQADAIYGDEGTDGPPPFEGFTYQHRINAGITGQQSVELTTGHGSMMPSAWGRDEFLGAEFSQSAPNGASTSTNEQQESSQSNNPPASAPNNLGFDLSQSAF